MGLLFNKPDDADNAITPSPAVYRDFRAITASAVRVDLRDSRQLESTARRLATETWQDDAWEYYDLIGEVKFTANMLASVLSRIRLYPALITDNSTVPSNLTSIKDYDARIIELAADALDVLSTGNGGISGLLRDAALNLFVAGECFLVEEPGRPSQGLDAKWQIRSVSEIIVKKVGRGERDKVSIKPSRNATEVDYIHLHDDAFCGRMWRNHGRYSEEADSSLRGLLELLDELLVANREARIASRSRLGNGILAIPDDFDAAYQSDGDYDADGEMAELSDDVQDSFQEALLAAIAAPVNNENSAEGLMPTLIRGPKEAIAAIRHISLGKNLDPEAQIRADKILDRILAGLDVPKDIVTGLASVKYSNAITIEETLYKAHIEPLVLMIVDQLTEVFYRPFLIQNGVDPKIARKSTLWYDPSAITTKPSKSESASEGFDKGIISEAAWRRSHGFPEADAPTQNEKAWRLAQQQGLISEPIMEALIKFNIPELYELARNAEMAANTAPEDQAALNTALGGEEESAPSDIIETNDNETATDLVEPDGME
jgi:hypothetical protein